MRLFNDPNILKRKKKKYFIYINCSHSPDCALFFLPLFTNANSEISDSISAADAGRCFVLALLALVLPWVTTQELILWWNKMHCCLVDITHDCIDFVLPLGGQDLLQYWESK